MKQAEHGVVDQCQCDNDQLILAIDDAFLSIIGRERGDVIGKQGLIGFWVGSLIDNLSSKSAQTFSRDTTDIRRDIKPILIILG